jgi:hypothetical protein
MRAALSVVFLALATAVAVAQPDGEKPDFARAAELYKQAEAAMSAGRYADAAQDYAIAYDITKDPVLFFKIASANDKAGRCDLALTYYRRYLKEGNPNDEFKKLTEERVAACEGGTGTTATTTTTKEPEPEPPVPPSTTTTPDDSTSALSTEKPSLTGSKPGKRRGLAWISLGVGIALGTVGVVAAMSAEAAEKDLKDLTDIRVQGRPPEFTADNQDRYDDLIAQGERYETLSWVAFGAAGAAFATATVLFLTSRGDSSSEKPPVAIQVTGDGAAITGTFGF